MTHLELELERLKNDLTSMFILVQKQLNKSLESLLTMNKDLAREIIATEKRVNAEELKIDRDCENIVALYTPVAVDLRLVFATFKINSHLERIGDNAKGIARYVLEMKEPFETNLIQKLELNKMFEVANRMIDENILAYSNADTSKARMVFEQDEKLDKINHAALQIIADYILEKPTSGLAMLNLLSIIRKLERVGDLQANIAEEIIFYVDAEVLKHIKQ